MKNYITILFIFVFVTSGYSQKVLTLEDALSVALNESYAIKSAEYTLINSQKNLEATKLGLMSTLNFEFDIPRYSRTLSSQFNPTTGSEQFFDVGFTTVEGRVIISQPIIFTNGNFSVTGSVFGRDQFSALSGTTRDYFSNLAFRLRQPLFTFNTQKANLERAEINLEKSKRNFTRSEADIIYNVTSGFYQLYQSMKNLEITEEKVKQTNASYETAMNKFRAGLIAEVEALQLEVDLASSKNELLDAKRRYDELKNNFKLLIGLPLIEDIEVSTELDFVQVSIDMDAAVNYALKNRPEIINAEFDIRLSELALDETDARKRIRADFTGNYGINKTDTELSRIFSEFAENRSVVFTLSVPIIDWGRNRREVEAAQANLQLNTLSYQNQQELIENEIISVVRRIQSIQARVEVLSKSVEVAERSYEISVERFDIGNITSFDLTQMQLRLTDAKINNLNALVDYKIALADLIRRTLVPLTMMGNGQ